MRTPEEFYVWASTYEDTWVAMMNQIVKKDNRRKADWIKPPPPKQIKREALISKYLKKQKKMVVMSK